MQLQIIIIIMLIFTTPVLLAKELGTVGPIYKIGETNLLHFIYAKLNQLNKNGNLGNLQKEYTKQIQKYVERPAGKNIQAAIKNRKWLFDPSLVLQKNIYNDSGVIIARKGTNINPLNHIALSKNLLFINADREKELEFAKFKVNDKPNTKIILVNGHLIKANKKLGLPVYFDQAAKLSTRFGIEYTPAIVVQKGDKLEIRELAL